MKILDLEQFYKIILVAKSKLVMRTLYYKDKLFMLLLAYFFAYAYYGDYNFFFFCTMIKEVAALTKDGVTNLNVILDLKIKVTVTNINYFLAISVFYPKIKHCEINFFST